MKKLMGVLMMIVFVLTACNSELAITELNSVPNNLKETLEVLGTKDYVQMLNNGTDISYVVINTAGTVTVSIEDKEDTILINIEEEENQTEDMKQHIFKLTKDRDYEFIELYKNGEAIPFHRVVGF